MPQWPDRLLDLALRSTVAVLLACAAVLGATLAVDLLHEAELGPAIRAQQAAALSGSSR